MASSNSPVHIVASILALVLGGGIGFGFAQLTRGTSPTIGPDPDNSTELKTLRAEREDLLAKIENQQAEIALLKELVRQAESLRKATTTTAEPSQTEGSAIAARSGPALTFEQARASFELVMSKHDIQGLWTLAFDLLRQGESGYQILNELTRDLESAGLGFQDLWRYEEIFLGSLLRDAILHSEDVLKFGLYIGNQPPEEVSRVASKFRSELLDDMGAVLFGFYEGDDPEVLDGYQQLISAKVEQGSVKRDSITILGQIRTRSSTQTLVDAFDKSDSDHTRRQIISALAWQGTDDSLSALRQLDGSVEDPRIKATIQSAIEYLIP